MNRSSVFVALVLVGPLSQLHAAALAPSEMKQPAAPVPRPVTQKLFGVSVTDNYRYFEKLGPRTIAWMTSEGDYTRKLFDSIAPRAALVQRVSEFTGSFGFVQSYAEYGGRKFYEERAPGADNFDLVVSDSSGTRKIVDIAAVMASNRGMPAAINYIAPSPDGSKVAVGLSQGGSEDAALSVYDSATGERIAGPVDRAQFGVSSWSNDSNKIYVVRLKAFDPTEPASEKYADTALVEWDLHSDPVPLYGATLANGPKFGAHETPYLSFSPTSPIAILESSNGVQPEFAVWTAPVATAANAADASWAPLASRDDGVTGLDIRGTDIFLLTHKNAPTFQVLTLQAGQPLATARVLVRAEPDRVIEGIYAASDALYVLARKGVYSQLLRVAKDDGAVQQIELPTQGHVYEAFTDARQPGVVLELSSWTLPPTRYRYDPGTGKFTDLNVGVHGAIDSARFVVSELEVRARDGASVPLSLIVPKASTTPIITVIEAYGAYGISMLADFSTRRAAFLKEGIAYGVCHVRGGGEKGEAWRLGGKDANKHNTWQDLIACGDELVARGITTRKQLFIEGGSAGGITMGRAMEERPELFAGVLDAVPDTNATRQEFAPGGPDNIPEFGSVRTEEGFRNLYAMDSVQHVRKGVAYPAILISTGLNDPRVAPWEPAKLEAALLAAGARNPTLLRVDSHAGHGIGSTRSQTDALVADWIAFVNWRAGVPGWQPHAVRSGH